MKCPVIIAQDPTPGMECPRDLDVCCWDCEHKRTCEQRCGGDDPRECLENYTD